MTAPVVDVTASMNDLVHFMELHSTLNLEQIWTSEVTYVHVITPSLQVGWHTIFFVCIYFSLFYDQSMSAALILFNYSNSCSVNQENFYHYGVVIITQPLWEFAQFI